MSNLIFSHVNLILCLKNYLQIDIYKILIVTRGSQAYIVSQLQLSYICLSLKGFSKLLGVIGHSSQEWQLVGFGPGFSIPGPAPFRVPGFFPGPRPAPAGPHGPRGPRLEIGPKSWPNHKKKKKSPDFFFPTFKPKFFFSILHIPNKKIKPKFIFTYIQACIFKFKPR